VLPQEDGRSRPGRLGAKPKTTLCLTAGERLPSLRLFHTIIHDGFALEKPGSQGGPPIGGFSAGFLAGGVGMFDGLG